MNHRFSLLVMRPGPAKAIFSPGWLWKVMLRPENFHSRGRSITLFFRISYSGQQ
jgi:hypothetical protein